ncbi:MAG: MarR family transcriptional regulator [Oligoflexia bacterium]|nr:MarR family transcriptional regulator [Oligoflexia bacterium]
MKESKEFVTFYCKIYKRFHQYWDKNEQIPSPEASAILLHLSDSGPLTILEASKHFKRSKSAMSEIVARMLKQGWIERVVNQDDRRVKYIWISPKGEETLSKASAPLDLKRLDDAFKGLEKKIIQNMFDAFEQLLKEN